MQGVPPLVLAKECWPKVNFFDKQREILCSMVDNDETVVVAGNELGKDFVAGYAVLWGFLTHPEVRIVTTSVRDDHLDILWGEIGRFIQTCKYDLDSRRGGPLLINHQHIRRVIKGQVRDIDYIKGINCGKPEGMAGHHAAWTMLAIDEASAVEQIVYDIACIWADCVLIFGNPNPCNNFFYKSVKAGNVKAKENKHLYRNIIRIRAQDSPNVRLGETQKRNGEKITNEILVPGVITYRDYKKRRVVFDKVKQCISLDGEFYEGAEVLMFPPEWLNRAEQLYDALKNKNRKAEAIGVDPAEGGNNTSMYAIDRLGIIEGVSKKTPDTSVIVGEVIAFAQKHGVRGENIYIDDGGGGKQHVDILRGKGYKVNAVFFGAAATPEKRRGMVKLETRKEEDEVRYVYKNRRIEMYWLLHLLLDPAAEGAGFAISSEEVKLRQQLAPIPKLTDGEGRLLLPPKHKPATSTGKESMTQTMIDLIGYSPDEADALVLAVFGMQNRSVGQGVSVW